MKVLPFKVQKTINDAIMVQEDILNVFYDKFHQHEEIQLSYILSGSGTLLVGDSIKPYNEGAIFLFGNKLPHVFKSDPTTGHKSHMISIFFTLENFGTELFKINELKSLPPLFQKAKSGLQITSPKSELEMLFFSIRDSIGLKRFIFFFELLMMLNNSEKIPLGSDNREIDFTDNEGQRMAKVYDYLMTNFQHSISLTELAQVASLTPTSFCRFFKAHTRKTLTQFLLELRIENACRLLKTKQSELKISSIAYQSGFNSISNFNRSFKKTKGKSPVEFRKSLLRKENYFIQ